MEYSCFRCSDRPSQDERESVLYGHSVGLDHLLVIRYAPWIASVGSPEALKIALDSYAFQSFLFKESRNGRWSVGRLRPNFEAKHTRAEVG